MTVEGNRGSLCNGMARTSSTRRSRNAWAFPPDRQPPAGPSTPSHPHPRSATHPGPVEPSPPVLLPTPGIRMGQIKPFFYYYFESKVDFKSFLFFGKLPICKFEKGNCNGVAVKGFFHLAFLCIRLHLQVGYKKKNRILFVWSFEIIVWNESFCKKVKSNPSKRRNSELIWAPRQYFFVLAEKCASMKMCAIPEGDGGVVSVSSDETNKTKKSDLMVCRSLNCPPPT